MDRPDQELIDVLVCDFEKRPRGAPGFPDLAHLVRSVGRDAQAVTVVFEDAAARDVAELVAAERLCCADLGWDLQTTPSVALRISGTAAQLDTLESLLKPG